MNFLIINRGQAALINPTNAIALSVREPNKPEPVYTHIPEDRILRMVFTDIDSYADAKRIGLEHLLCTKDHARSILDFVKKFENEPGLTVVCQCDGGICRSSAMAAALTVIYNGAGEDSDIFRIKNPNMLVYRLILNEWAGVNY